MMMAGELAWVGVTMSIWASGDAYEPYVGRWSRLVAPVFLDWLAVPSGARWLDVGCGTGALTSAILDVCETEPPAPDHPFWRHPKIWLTPHIASTTQPESAVEAVLANLARHERGEPMLGLVDRNRGY